MCWIYCHGVHLRFLHLQGRVFVYTYRLPHGNLYGKFKKCPHHCVYNKKLNIYYFNSHEECDACAVAIQLNYYISTWSYVWIMRGQSSDNRLLLDRSINTGVNMFSQVVWIFYIQIIIIINIKILKLDGEKYLKLWKYIYQYEYRLPRNIYNQANSRISIMNFAWKIWIIWREYRWI